MNTTIPLAFVRPDDGELFTINPSGKYSLDFMKKRFPYSYTHEYSEVAMRGSGFNPLFTESAISSHPHSE
jgi:hypothetical protein